MYDQLAERVGAQLDVDPTHIRFYTVNSSGAPRMTVKRSSTNQTLQSILSPTAYSQLNQNQRNDALYFEVLDMSLAELDTKKNIKISWLSEGITKEASTLLFPRIHVDFANLELRSHSTSWCPRMASSKM